MSLTSWTFFAFLIPVALSLRWAPERSRKWILFGSSLCFYAFAGWIGLLALVALAIGNGLVALYLSGSSDSAQRSVVFWAAIVANLVYLFGFKYLRMFSVQLAGDVDLLPSVLSDWIAPLGISFLTVQMMGALADAFTRLGVKVLSVTEFLQFVFFFPQMTIGPIGRTASLLPQLRSVGVASGQDLAEGSALILQGLAKKFVIADRLGSYVQAVENPGGLYYGSFVLWVSMVFYFIQLYADFSGYSDMAIGCARLVGVKLPPNFNRPLGADSVTEFWRRWHISFSNWLRDYIYMPLFIHFRNLGTVAMIGSLLATFLLCGIWHGLGVTFAVFGLAHGIAMSVEALTKKTRSRLLGFWPARVGQTLGIAYTFVFCASAAVLFRANSLADALQFYKQLLAFMPLSGASELFAYKGPFMFLLTVFAALLILVVDQPAEKLVGAKHPWVKSFALAALILVLGKGAGGEFIYEQF